MKEKFSGLSTTVIGIVTIFVALLVTVGGSAAMMLAPQGGGRPTPRPKPTSAGRTKPPAPRPRTKAPVNRAGNGNSAAPNRNAAANGNANASARSNVNDSTRPHSIVPVSNTNNSNSANASAVPSPTSTPTMTTPADETKGAPVLDQFILTEDGRLIPRVLAQPKPNPDADILLPEDLRKLESGYPISPGFEPEPKKLINTTGAFSEIANKRKVFVNNGGEYGDKITARLKAYNGLEIVKTAGEAEFAVWYDDWAKEERFKDPSSPLGIWTPETVKTVTGGTLIVTIRDPSEHVPRIIWRKDNTDGGLFKRGDAYDKLIKRFISELKKLRGEK